MHDPLICLSCLIVLHIYKKKSKVKYQNWFGFEKLPFFLPLFFFLYTRISTCTTIKIPWCNRAKFWACIMMSFLYLQLINMSCIAKQTWLTWIIRVWSLRNWLNIWPWWAVVSSFLLLLRPLVSIVKLSSPLDYLHSHTHETLNTVRLLTDHNIK